MTRGRDAGSTAQGSAASALSRRAFLAGTAGGAMLTLTGCAAGAEQLFAGGSSGTTITVAIVSNSQMQDAISLSYLFEREHPGVHLSFVSLPENEARAKITTDVSTQGGEFDVVMISNYETPMWSANGWLVNLQPYIDVSPACRCPVMAWSMVVLLKKRVQLKATVSTSGVLAEEKRLVAAPRFAAARNPPTGESAVSTGASSRATRYAAIGPKKAAATTRKIALSSDVAAAVYAVSVMVLQVGAVSHKLPAALAEDREALTGVERAGRSALAEMRHLLDAMREDEERAELGPQPGLDRLDALLQDVGRAGLPVRLHVDGNPPDLPRGIDISAYRIVQEGLTNVLKHADATQAEVALEYASDQLRIEVSDNGHGAGESDGLGHGLIGIHEGVKLYNGEMTTATAKGGGFTLTACLPLTGYRS